jgi:hypothetical protein
MENTTLQKKGLEKEETVFSTMLFTFKGLETFTNKHSILCERR